MEALERPNILIVDDNKLNLHLLEFILGKLDVNLIIAESGMDALSKIQNKEIALALLDFNMPEMDGVQLAILIQEDKNRDKVPIIFITGQVNDEMLPDKCYQAGAVDFLLKPFKQNILLNKVKVFLELFEQKRRILKDHLALIESEKMYRTLLNASPEGIIIMNMKGVITEISNITLEIFGYENKKDFIGVQFFNFIPHEELKKLKDVLSKTKTEGLVQNVEFYLFRRDRSQFICDISTTLIQEADGKPRSYMAIIRDISYRKKMEQQLIRTERLVSLGEMASAMAHEINQPLLSITLGIENLFLKMQQINVLDEKYFHDKSEKIFNDVARIGRIIDHVRAFSREHDDYMFTSFDINESIENAIAMIGEQFKHHGIKLILKLDKDVDPVSGNTYRFEQVILNLLNNAKDAIEEKAKKIKSDFKKTINIKSWHDTHTIYVEVKDNGTGISSEVIDRIMLPFYTTKETGKGTGLGLSISFGIIKEMNGNIDIESEPNSGTTFRISLPVPEIKEKT